MYLVPSLDKDLPRCTTHENLKPSNQKGCEARSYKLANFYATPQMGEYSFKQLHTSSFRWAAPIMRYWSHILDHGNVKPKSMKCPKCGFSSGARALNIYLDIPDAMLLGLFRSIFRGYLGRERRTLPRSLEALAS